MLFDDILGDQRTPEEKLKDMREELDDAIREVRELQDELANKDKRTARAHELLKQTKRYIKCLQDKLGDEELEQAKSEFDRLERETAQVTADLEDESDGNS
jgi:chromosome segregation ATPase